MIRFTRIGIPILLAAVLTGNTVVTGELVVLQEDPTFCIASKAAVLGAKLKVAKCDSKSDLQNWKAEPTAGGVVWKLAADENLCVEASQLLKKKKRARLNRCKRKKKQRWSPNYSRSSTQDITTAKNNNLCIAYSGSTPRVGRNIKLLECSGETKQGWLWLNEDMYQKHLNDGSSTGGVQEVASRSFYISASDDPIPRVALRTIDPTIMDGYTAGSSGCKSLYDDIFNATLLVANEQIKTNVENYYGDDKLKYRPPMLEDGPIRAPTMELDDTVGAAPESAKGQNTESSFETNVQEAGVDEADIVKSDGKTVYAAYGDLLVAWDADTGKVRSKTKMAPKTILSYEEGGFGDGGGYQGPYVKPAVVEDIGRDNDGRRQRHLKGRRGSIWLPPNPKPRISGLLLDSDNNRLAVLVSGYKQEYRWDYYDRPILTDKGDTRVMLFDTSSIPTDGSKLNAIASRDMWGSYRSARMIGSKVHVAVQTSVDWWPHVTRRLDPWQVTFDGLDKDGYIEAANREAKVAADRFAKRLVAELRELSGADGGSSSEDCSGVTRVAVFASSEQDNDDDVDGYPETIISGGLMNSYLQVSTFDMSSSPLKASTKLKMETSGSFFPSNWGEIYASQDVMVVSGRGYNRRPRSRVWDESTYLLALKLHSDGSAPLTAPSGIAMGKVQGYLLNQWAMDEYEGHLRVATTTNAKWGCLDEPQKIEDEERVQPCKWGQISDSVSQVYIMKLPEGSNREMEQVAMVDKLGPTEVIMSARFFNDKAYIVTFRRTDPLYVLDLSNHKNPVVTDALKITGFSSYMHPIGNDKLLAIGREADEEGRVMGFAITIFDVSDATNTVPMARYMIDDRSSSSNAEGDSKAFRYLDKSKKLILPISSYDSKAPFDGFRVFDIDDVCTNYKTKKCIKESFSVSMVPDPQLIVRGCYYDAYIPARSMVFSGNAMFIKGHGYVSYNLDDGSMRWYHSLDKGVEKDQCFGYWR